MFRKINLLLFVIVTITITSCSEDFLETKPTDAISASDALATADNMALILNGLHRGLYSQSQTILPGGNTARAGNHFWIPMGDNLTGGLIHSANANNLGWRDTAQWLDHTQETSLTNEILWYHRYNIIASANAIINKATDGSIPEDDRLREIIGQAYTYRAYAYLSLVQHYAKGYLIGSPSSDPGVPLLFASEAPFTSEPRSTVQEIYNQIKLDLDTAIGYFENATPRPTGSANNKSQLNIDVAYGLKARAALDSGDWATAATAAVTARQNYPLMDESDWKSGFNTTLLPEVIWGSNVITTETTFFRSYFYLMSNTFNGSQVRNNPKIADRRLVDQIPDTDYRKFAFLKDAPNSNTSASNGLGGWANNTNPLYTTEEEFDAEIDRLASVWGWTSRHNTHPYMHVKMRQKIPGGIEPDDIIYIRSSEMYLIEAEAKAMLNDVPGAQAALRPLGEARDSAYDVTVFATQADLMAHIKFQRALELWGEGFGYTDKIRWDEGFDHGTNGGSGATETLYQDGFRQDKPSVNNAWIFKIPQKEIDANPNIGPGDQN
jgi:starch-binding outer membrane protein, SusD/RagB family